MLAILFLVGFTSLVYEIYSLTVMFMFIVESAQASAIAVSAFLSGLAVSAWAASRLLSRKGLDEALVMAVMQLIAGAYAGFILTHHEWIPRLLDYLVPGDTPGSLAHGIVLWVYLFIPAVFIGAAFPIVSGMKLSGSGKNAISKISTVYAWDIAGSIAGALATGFILIPHLGLSRTVLFTSVLNFAVAIVLSFRKSRWLTLLTGITLLTVLLQFHFSRSPKVHSASDQLEKRLGKVIFQENSQYGKITVGTNVYMPGDKALFINYRDMCNAGGTNSEKFLGRYAIATVPENASVLNIGLGCGFTASEVERSPKVSSVDIVEINPIVAKVSEKYFSKENNNVLKSPKVRLHLTDGAKYLRTTEKKYDAIIIDIEEITVVYSSPLYTREYFKLAQEKLKPGGRFVVWSFFGNEAVSKILDNTMRSVFKNSQLRILNGYLNVFGSDGSLDDLAVKEPHEKKLLAAISNLQLESVNTLDGRELEKHYDIRKVFKLPKDYKEAYLSR